MSITLPSTSTPLNPQPSAFSQLAQRSNGCGIGGNAGMFASNGCALSYPMDTGALTFTEMRDIFGVLLGKPRAGALCETDPQRFMKAMDLNAFYRNRTVEFFGDVVTAELRNANDFLFNVSPVLETDEMHFTFYQKDSSLMPFTEIATCGVPEEIGMHGEHYTYTWTETVKKYEQAAMIERDLALDVNFGMQYWMEILTQFIRNALLTMKMSIITTLVQVGYMNMTRNQQLGLPMDVHKLYMNESALFLIMAEDPEAGLNAVRDLYSRFKPNMLIIPQGASRHLAKTVGQPMPTRAERFVIDEITGQAVVRFIEGPTSAKTISMGNGDTLDVVEFDPFVLDSQSTMPINPLRTRNTIGQFYPPNPLLKPDDCVKSTCSDILDIGLLYQTKSISREERVSMAQRLKASMYWDEKTGRVSALAVAYARDLQKKRCTLDSAPWDWNVLNPRYRQGADINEELCNNCTPIMSDVDAKTNLHEMRSWRSEYVGVTYVPSDNSYRIPVRFGDFHLRSISNEWVHKAAKQLGAKAAEKMGVPDIEEMFMKIERFRDAMDHAEWNDAYLFALNDKNAPKMITPNAVGGGFTLVPDRTPSHRTNEQNIPRECKFPTSAGRGIEEFRQNRFGFLDLPDRDPGAGIRQVYPPGFNSGAGWLTLEQESLKESTSLWLQAGRDAAEVVNFLRFLLKFTEEYIGEETDVINPSLTGNWIHKESKLIALIDYIIKPSGPTFMGIPDVINYEDVGPEARVPTQKANLTPNAPLRDGMPVTLLQPTIAETNAFIRAQINANARRKPVTQEERALSCLGPDAYAKMYAIIQEIDNLIGADETFVVEYTKVLHQLYDFVVDLCGYEEDGVVERKNIEVSSIIIDAFVDRLRSLVATQPPTTIVGEVEIANFVRDTTTRGLKQFVGSLVNEKTMQRTYNQLKKAVDARTASVCIDYGTGFADALREYEETGPAFAVTVEQGEGARAINEPPVYRADYTLPPAKWLRAPITSSQALRDYLRNKVTPWILPADSRQFYEKPEEPRIVTSNATIDVRLHGNNRESLCILAKAPLLQSRLNAARPQEETRTTKQVSAARNQSDDLFRSFKSTKSSVTSADKLFSFGQSYRDDENAELSYSEATRKRVMPRVSSLTGEIEVEDTLREEFFGPWRARLEYSNRQIKQASEKFFFNAIIQAKNRLDTPVRLSAAGAQILDVVIVRPFIETRTDAMIAVKAGQGTLVTTIGHSHVQVTKESLGCWHITCGFYLGILKVNPNNIALFPNAFPVSLIGGKNTDFMTDLSDWNRPNPAKRSMLGFLISADERKVASPAHLRNEETYIRPGIDYAIWERKLTAFGAWYEFMLRNYNPENIDALHAGRSTYASCVPVSHVLNLGPTVYIDPQTEKKIYMEGAGPMGSWRMNWPGCHDIYEGRSSIFPYPNYNNQQL